VSERNSTRPGALRPPPSNTLRASLELLASRRFGTFWFASLLSSVGTWAQQVAQPWLLLTLGASPFLVGLDSFAMSGPVWLLTLTGGILADRADRRRVIAGFQSLQMLCPVIIVVLLLNQHAKPWMIVSLSLVVGITDALSMPSYSSIVPSIVEHRQIGAALALNSTQFNISRIAGPTLAGVLMAGAGALWCFVVSALSYLPFIGVALWILPHGRPAGPPPVEPVAGHLFAGAKVILRDGYQRGALLTALATGLLCGPLVTFTPLLVRDIFHGGAAQFSLAVTAFGAGGLLGALALLAVPPEQDRRRLGTIGALVFAAMLVAAAYSTNYAISLVVLAFAGLSMNVTNTSTNTLVQTTAMPQLRGQAVSLYMLAMRGGLALGALVMGFSVQFWGIRHALMVNGLLAVAVQLVIAHGWRAPALDAA
jgi:MFS family permease